MSHTPSVPSPLSNRVALAEQLRRSRHEVAELVTEEFLHRHPDWLERYGDRARTHGVADALFHQDFLAGALEADSVTAFQDYARWTAGMLAARGIDPGFLRENLRQIGAALQARLPASHHLPLARFVDAACEAATGHAPSAPADETTGALRSVYVQALRQGARRPALTVILDAVERGWNIPDLYTDVLQAAMYEIGRLWETNAITVAEEHTATAITQHVLAHLYERLPRGAPARGRAVITGVAGELHQVGANIVADALEADGWDVRFLGTNMPHAGILKVLEEHAPAAIGISATMLFNVPSVRQLVSDIRRRGSGAPRVVLGGAAFRTARELPAEIGADGFAPDVRDAIQVFRSLAPAA